MKERTGNIAMVHTLLINDEMSGVKIKVEFSSSKFEKLFYHAKINDQERSRYEDQSVF